MEDQLMGPLSIMLHINLILYWFVILGGPLYFGNDATCIDPACQDKGDKYGAKADKYGDKSAGDHRLLAAKGGKTYDYWLQNQEGLMYSHYVYFGFTIYSIIFEITAVLII